MFGRRGGRDNPRAHRAMVAALDAASWHRAVDGNRLHAERGIGEARMSNSLASTYWIVLGCLVCMGSLGCGDPGDSVDGRTERAVDARAKRRSAFGGSALYAILARTCPQGAAPMTLRKTATDPANGRTEQAVRAPAYFRCVETVSADACPSRGPSRATRIDRHSAMSRATSRSYRHLDVGNWMALPTVSRATALRFRSSLIGTSTPSVIP